MEEGVKLLVHAGAPSGFKDDEMYITEASSYLAMRRSRIKRIDLMASNENEDERASSHATWAPNEGTDTRDVIKALDSPTAFLEDTQLAYECLESQITSESLAVAEVDFSVDRECHPTAGAGGRVQARDQDSSQSTSSQASYLKTPLVGKPKACEEYSPSNLVCRGCFTEKVDGDVPAHHHIENQSTEDRTFALPEQTSDHTGEDSTSELPTSYSLSSSGDMESEDHVSLPGHPTPTPTVHTFEQPHHPDLDHAILDYNPMKQTQEDPSSHSFPSNPTELNPTVLESEMSDPATEPGPIPANFPEQSQVPPQSSSKIPEELSKLSKTIQPPSPAVSIERFVTFLTPSLIHLAEHSEVAECFHPVTTTREIDKVERGHWLIEGCGEWPIELLVDFWQFLQQLVGNSCAGWGVWCTREEEFFDLRGDGGDEGNRMEKRGGRESQGEKSAKMVEDGREKRQEARNDMRARAEDEKKGGSMEDEFGMIKVYCWGEVVKHVYLVLYVASRGKVRKMGLKWIDSEEKVVVQMRGK